MNQSQSPLIINIGFLINHPVGYARVLPFEFNEMDMGDGLLLHAVHGTINFTRTQDGFIAGAIFNAEVESECSRCLVPFQNKIHSEFEEYFTFLNGDLSEDEIKIPKDGNIDFKPILHDYMLIELPINPICRPDCKGICPICGQNLNQAVCEHYQNHEMQDIGSDAGGQRAGKENQPAETLIT
ncbi:MAG: DUF177 domain-containing protein [Anaerolineaceae bacterium]|nr:DUF177 domain-containing protein [Anaerolineaceae bacterium]